MHNVINSSNALFDAYPTTNIYILFYDLDAYKQVLLLQIYLFIFFFNLHTTLILQGPTEYTTYSFTICALPADFIIFTNTLTTRYPYGGQ